MSDMNGQGSAERELIERYIESWNEFDPARRAKLIDELWAQDGRYVDPDVDARGRDAIGGVLTAGRERLGTLIFTLGEVISVHHDLALFTWQVRPAADAEPVVAGHDVAEFSAGRVTRIYAFYTPPQRPR